MTPEEDHLQELYSKAIVIDGLNASYTDAKYFLKMIKANITAANWTVAHPFQDFRGALKQVLTWRTLLEANSAHALLATSAAHIHEAKKTNRVAVVMGFQNAKHMEDDISLLHLFHKLGIRIVQPTYNEGNLVGDGCLERTASGLTKFGIALIEEMNRLRMLIDLSHCGYKTTMEAIEFSKSPAIFSHANPKSMCDNPRNKTDDEIKALAEKGGVVGICAFSPLLKREPEPTMNDFLDHIDYAVNLVGAGHVGVGLDLEEGETIEEFCKFKSLYPEVYGSYEFQNEYSRELDLDCLRDIAQGLIHRGYSDKEVQQILGLNFLRVFKLVLG